MGYLLFKIYFEMAPCLVSDKGLLDLKDFYSNIEKYINRSSLHRNNIL